MKNFLVKDISSKELKTFFDIFGFIKISGFFKDEISDISREFNTSMDKKFGLKKEQTRNYFYPQFIEYSEYLSTLVAKEKIVLLMKNLLGEDPIFTGSDGNIFAGSTPWHRDYLIKNRSCKVLSYLDEVDGTSGALRVIPGSHFIDDKFSAFLGDGLTWPEQPFEGGFDEKALFGKGHNPTKYKENSLIPSAVIEINPGDIIVFNHNLIHCTNFALKKSFKWTKYGFRKQNIRRMFGMHFFSNPKNVKNEQLRKSLEDNMETLFQIEMESFKLDRRFGPAIHDSKSKTIQNFIVPIKNLKCRSQKEGSFDGKYTKQSDECMQYHNNTKPFGYNNNLEIN